MPLFNVDGTDIHYETYGQGDAIVFLPGLGCCMKAWNPQKEFFSEKFRVVCLDYRGHGESGFGSQPFTMPLFAKDVQSLLDYLGIGKTIVCGLSLGSLVAQQFAFDYPGFCRALILCGTHVHPGVKEKFLGKLVPIVVKRYLKKKTLIDFATGTAAKVFPKPDQEELRNFYSKEVISTTAEGYLKAWEAVRIFDSYRHLRSVKRPVLIYNGEKEDAFIKKQAQLLCRRIPHAIYKTMPDAGHIINLERQDEFNRTVQGFITEHVLLN